MHHNPQQLNNPDQVPYTFFSFAISHNASGILLKWMSSSEINIDRYDILHSRDGVHFSKLTHITARGNSIYPSNYEWIHKTPANGSNYYRLQQFDKEGLFYLSEIKHLL